MGRIMNRRKTEEISLSLANGSTCRKFNEETKMEW